MLLIRNDVNFKNLALNQYNNGKLELHGIVVSSALGEISILNIYNPSENVTLDEILHYMDQLGNSFVMVGDYNAHSPLWDRRGRSNFTGRTLEQAMNVSNMQLLNDDTPTYIDRKHSTTSCLDLCFLSPNLHRTGEMMRGPDVASDHFPMYIKLGIKLKKQEMKTCQKWNLKKANWDQWRSEIEGQRRNWRLDQLMLIL